MPFHRALIALSLLSVLLTFALPATAQQEMDVRELNKQGLQAFGEGRFEDAAESFDRAYALEPRPELLKNEAVSWYKAERCEEAVESAHQFLRTDDIKPADRNEVTALLGACRVKLAQEAIEVGSFELAERLLDEVEASEPDAVLADRVARVRIELSRARADAKEREESSDDVIEPMPMDSSGDDTPTVSRENTADEPGGADLDVREPDSPRRDGRLSGWPFVGIGIASLVGGVVYHVLMATVVEPDFLAVAEEGEDFERYEKLSRQLRTANVLVPTLYGVGAASTAVGVFLVVRPSDGREGMAMVGVRGSF